MTEPEAPVPPLLTKSTLVPISLLVAGILTAVGATWTLATGFGDLRRDITIRDGAMALRFQSIEMKLDSLEGSSLSRDGTIWTRSQQATYVEAMRAANPTMRFPDVDRIK